MSVSYKTFNQPAGPAVNGVAYIEDTISGIFRPARSSDFGGGGGSTSVVGVTGVVTINSGSFGNGIAILTGSQLVLPAGLRSWSFAVQSGSAYVNGSGSFDVGFGLSMGGYDGRWITSSPVVIGCTGGKTYVTWEV